VKSHTISSVIGMVNMTLSIPNKIHEEMKKYSEIRWSEVARQAIVKKLNDLKILEKILEKSTLREEDIDEIDHIIKAGLLVKHKKLKKMKEN